METRSPFFYLSFGPSFLAKLQNMPIARALAAGQGWYDV